MSTETDHKELEELARRARWLVLSTVAKSGAGHVGGPMSATELLISLYFRVMAIRPEEPHWPGRDRFILSKGHSAIGQYTVMALRGYFPVEELQTFDKGRSRLQGHPDATKLTGLETSTGSLGQGLSVGLGFALAARLSGQKFHTYVLLGDGELQEGMIWEALHIAPRYNLGNLTAIVDWNGLQQFGWPVVPGDDHSGDRRDPWAGVNLAMAIGALGWRILEVNGNDFSQVIPALEECKRWSQTRQPTMVLAHTTKGKGLSFTAGKYEWHSKVANAQELDQAKRELGIVEVSA